MAKMDNGYISHRLQNLPISAIRKLVPIAQKVKSQGVRVLHLNIGDPDILTPSVMIERLRGWQGNPIGYAPSVGTPEFLAAITSYYTKCGYPFIKPEDLIVTVGGSEALAFAFFAVCEQGDEVLVFEPFYSNYDVIAQINGLTLIAAPTTLKDGFHIPRTQVLEKSLTPKTKAVLISNPCNPTGTVYTKKEIERLLAFCLKHKLVLISDEVYREFIFVKRAHASLFPYVEKYPEQLIVLDSLSKRYSLCGARLGIFAAKSKPLIVGVTKMAMGRLSGGLIDQTMAAALTQVPQAYFDEIALEYQKRRDILFAGMSKIKGVSITQPEGAFYCMVQLPVADAEHFCRWLLETFRDHNETVMLAPGAGFYKTPGKGVSEVRIAYVLEEKKLRRCIEILEKALQTYSISQ